MDYVFIVDFEATCDEGFVQLVTRENQEIIEFPVVIYDVKSKKIIDEKHFYIKPVLTEGLTPFCSKLTGITDDLLSERGTTLEHVISELDSYIDQNFSSNTFCFLTDGPWDMRFALQNDVINKKIVLKDHYRKFIDLQKMFSFAFPQLVYHPKPNLRFMCEFLRVPIEGHHHSGLDDCKTVVNILTELLNYENCGKLENFVEEIPLDYDPRSDMSIADFGGWFTPSTINVRDVIKCLHFTNEQVLNVYRLPFLTYEIADYFFVLVAKDYKAVNNYFKRKNIAAKVYSQYQFQSLLDYHDLTALSCMSVPDSDVWKNTWEFNFSLSLRRLKFALMGEIGLAFSTGRRAWKEGNKYKAKNIMAYILKALSLNFENGKITNLFLPIREEIFETRFSSWDEIEAKYRPEYEKLHEEFKKAIHKGKQEFVTIDSKIKGEGLNIVQIIKEKGLANISLYLSVNVRRHPQYRNLIHLMHDKEFSVTEVKGVQECNPLILDESEDYKVVCCTFLKFFSFDHCFFGKKEKAIEKVDLKQSWMHEKLDGYMCTMYYYGNEWQIATFMTADGSESVTEFSEKSVKNLFFEMFNAKKYVLPKDTNSCFSFMLMSPLIEIKDSGILSQSNKEDLILIAARDLRTMQESTYPELVEISKSHSWNVIPQLESPSDVKELTKQFIGTDPLEFEGFIICDSQFNRVKIATPQYQALKEIMKLVEVRKNLLTMLVYQTPQSTFEKLEPPANRDIYAQDMPFETIYKVLLAKYESKCSEIQKTMDQVAHIADDKEFAKSIQKCKYSAILFAMKKQNKTKVKDFLPYAATKFVENLFD